MFQQPTSKYNSTNDQISFGSTLIKEESFTNIPRNLVDSNRVTTPATITTYDQLTQYLVPRQVLPFIPNSGLLLQANHPAFISPDEEEEEDDDNDDDDDDDDIKPDSKPSRKSLQGEKKLAKAANKIDLVRTYNTRPQTTKWVARP